MPLWGRSAHEAEEAALARAAELREQADADYQRVLGELASLRRAVAAAAASRARVELHLAGLRSEQDELAQTAARALNAGDSEQARTLLARRRALDAEAAALWDREALLAADEEQLRRAKAQLERSVDELRARRQQSAGQGAASLGDGAEQVPSGVPDASALSPAARAAADRDLATVAAALARGSDPAAALATRFENPPRVAAPRYDATELR